MRKILIYMVLGLLFICSLLVSYQLGVDEYRTKYEAIVQKDNEIFAEYEDVLDEVGDAFGCYYDVQCLQDQADTLEAMLPKIDELTKERKAILDE